MSLPTSSRRELPTGLIYTLFAVLILALVIWGFTRYLKTTDTRDVAVWFPEQGSVTLRLDTDPYPPLPSGTVQLNLMGMNRNNAMVDLGPEVPFAFGPQGSDTPQGGGSALALGDGNYRAGVVFSVPGTYWLLFDLGGGKTARFQIRVEPAQ